MSRDGEDEHGAARAGAVSPLGKTEQAAAGRPLATTLDATAPGDGAGATEVTVTEIGRFKVLSKLGQGGMGVVLLATDPALDRRVAIKILHGTPGSISESASQRLLREAQGMAKLSHDNVIVVHEVGTHGDQVYLAMEYVVGGTLRRWQAGRDWREILDMYVRAGRGLQAAHDAGLVHRDFKPDNVLVGDDGRVRVTDFGLVSTVDAPEAGRSQAAVDPRRASPSTKLTQTGAVMGTPRYMAPEQHDGQAVDPRADQFAFCVALFEALYRVPPFAGTTYAELVANVLAGAIVPVPADSKVPLRVRDAVLRGLRRDRTERHGSMRELLALLAADEAPASRRRWPLAVGIGAVALGLAIAVVLARPSGHSDHAPAPAPAVAPPRTVEGATSGIDVTALKQAQADYDQARSDFRSGKYDEAARGFQAAFAATPVPQFWYDVGASLFMKGARDGDTAAYAGAVAAYTRYLSSDPIAPGIAEAIDVIKREIERIEAERRAGRGSGVVAPSTELQKLGVPQPRGFVMLISQPLGATIYIDDPDKGPFGTTPWAGTLRGEHTVMFAKSGYQTAESTLSFDPSQLFVLSAVLSDGSAAHADGR